MSWEICSHCQRKKRQQGPCGLICCSNWPHTIRDTTWWTGRVTDAILPIQISRPTYDVTHRPIYPRGLFGRKMMFHSINLDSMWLNNVGTDFQRDVFLQFSHFYDELGFKNRNERVRSHLPDALASSTGTYVSARRSIFNRKKTNSLTLEDVQTHDDELQAAQTGGRQVWSAAGGEFVGRSCTWKEKRWSEMDTTVWHVMDWQETFHWMSRVIREGEIEILPSHDKKSEGDNEDQFGNSPLVRQRRDVESFWTAEIATDRY